MKTIINYDGDDEKDILEQMMKRACKEHSQQQIFDVVYPISCVLVPLAIGAILYYCILM